MRSIAMAVFVAASSFAAPGGASETAPHLTLPDGSVLELPPGSHAFGPDGPVFTPMEPRGGQGDPASPASRAGGTPPVGGPQVSEAPGTADPAERRNARLNELYDRLVHAVDPTEASAIGGMIASMLARSGSDTADLLMERAVAAMDGKNNATAAALLDKVIALQPRWAEAWNKRATVRYLDDDDVGAMADIGQVLALEPRHFGALSGMGLILHRNGDDKDALVVLQRAAAINPQEPQVKQMIDALTPAVRGQDL